MKQDTYIEVKALTIGLESDELKAQIVSDAGQHVAYIEIDPAIEIANQIVTRYNSHEELAKALQGFIRVLSETSPIEYAYEIKQAKEVLTKAGLKY